MKIKMKKRILSLAVVFCLALSLAACGNSSTKETATEEQTTQEPSTAEDTDSTSITLEDYFNSEAMQTMVDAAKEQYTEQGINAEMYAEGDELKYDFTVTSLTGLSEDERSILSDTLKTSMESSSDSFQDTADQAKAVVSNETVTVVVTYYDGDGNVLYTQSFASGQ